MRKIGDAASGDLLAALERLERSRAGSLQGAAKGAQVSSPPEPREIASQARPERQSAAIRSLAAERAERRKQDAKTMVQIARSLGVQGEALAIMKRAAEAAKTEPSEWTFVMISPQQNAAVVGWIAQNSKRPIAATRLWAELFAHMRSDTGEILETRQQLADRIGILPRDLSSIMGELEKINAIRREKRGRLVVYYMNPNIATHLPAKARDAAQKRAGPLLVMMEGGKPDIAPQVR